jgi:hypothetical protein
LLERLTCGGQIGARTLRKALIVASAVVAISMTIVLQRIERYYCSPTEDPSQHPFWWIVFDIVS